MLNPNYAPDDKNLMPALIVYDRYYDNPQFKMISDSTDDHELIIAVLDSVREICGCRQYNGSTIVLCCMLAGQSDWLIGCVDQFLANFHSTR